VKLQLRAAKVPSAQAMMRCLFLLSILNVPAEVTKVSATVYSA
jgi:hypothetical protein